MHYMACVAGGSIVLYLGREIIAHGKPRARWISTSGGTLEAKRWSAKPASINHDKKRLSDPVYGRGFDFLRCASPQDGCSSKYASRDMDRGAGAEVEGSGP